MSANRRRPVVHNESQYLANRKRIENMQAYVNAASALNEEGRRNYGQMEHALQKQGQQAQLANSTQDAQQAGPSHRPFGGQANHAPALQSQPSGAFSSSNRAAAQFHQPSSHPTTSKPFAPAIPSHAQQPQTRTSPFTVLMPQSQTLPTQNLGHISTPETRSKVQTAQKQPLASASPHSMHPLRCTEEQGAAMDERRLDTTKWSVAADTYVDVAGSFGWWWRTGCTRLWTPSCG
ncbi:hypothetical protein R3P38DRAFT_2794646 [Favolaschia claudopus]|uniref:Uncharacterized protein n=1 Tax=Favolaschia claudopus TaxID=2862362 RepID=A0AAW0A9M2_9AGAR